MLEPTQLTILDTKLLGVIAHAALAKVDKFDTQSMANIVWAYARLGHSDLPLAIAIAKRAAAAAEEFTTQVLHDLSNAGGLHVLVCIGRIYWVKERGCTVRVWRVKR